LKEIKRVSIYRKFTEGLIKNYLIDDKSLCGCTRLRVGNDLRSAIRSQWSNPLCANLFLYRSNLLFS